jgi:alpha-glucosidase
VYEREDLRGFREQLADLDRRRLRRLTGIVRSVRLFNFVARAGGSAARHSVVRRRTPSLARSAVIAIVAVVAACGDDPAPSDPVRASYGVFGVTLEPDSARVVIAGPDGKALFDGLPASDETGTGFSENDALPPMTGFATRDVTTTFAMSFGSFSWKDDAAAWRRAKKARWTGGDAPLDLVDGGGSKIASLAFARGDSDQHLVVDIKPGDGPERRFSWGIRCDADDHFLGFGAQTWGTDARGESIPIWVQEQGIKKDLGTDDPIGAWFLVGRRHSSYMPMPEFLSRRGYFAVAETDRLSTFAMCSERADVARLQLEMPVKLHLFFGPSPREALERKTAKFGRPRLPPDFAFAPWNDAIYGPAEVRRVAAKLRAVGAPSSVIWTEDWRGGGPDPVVPDGYTLKEGYDVDRNLYPDFEAIASELHTSGFKWLVYFSSFLAKELPTWPEVQGYAIKKDGAPYVFSNASLKDASMVDFTQPAARDWTIGKLKAALELGADGWMGDFSEWLPTDAELANGSALELHNRYPIMWQDAQRAALDGVADGREKINFVRTGWFGTPERADVFWAGDQSTDFGVDDGLPTIIPMGIGVGLSGVSTYGHDIAGYNALNTIPPTKELFFRWTELGAWTPVMRTHHGTVPKVSWNWEKDDETVAHWVRYTKQHMALAPYFIGLTKIAHDTGVPIWRSLAFEYSNDAAAWPIADQVLVGDGVLVAPIQAEGATTREVYLPAARWYPWAGGAALEGGRKVTANAPLGEIPVYARAGAVVPTFPDGVETLVREPSNAKGASDSRIVFAFAGADGAFTERDGVRFEMTSTPVVASGDAATATFEGAPLAACPATPCAEITGEHVRAQVTGPGKLVVTRGGASIAEVRVTNANPAASLTIDVRY